ncbi:MAG: NAD(P)/FAD-dependent oxidoreductase [Pseudomonadota bacterium]
MHDTDVIILGGGAAGLMCALTAGQRGLRVVVLEGANKIGKKILMSGGGRCNFTNLHCSAEHFLSANPHFCKSALSQYTQWDFIALVEQHGIAYHEKTLGQLFCDVSSKDIVAMLKRECDTAGVDIRLNSDVRSVDANDGFVVDCAHGQWHSGKLVIATGGLSIPKMGASDFGYRLARQFGMDVLPTRAALVPLTFSGALHQWLAALAGVSVEVTVNAGDNRFHESMLFTHRGLSGPSVLQISSYWQPGQTITVDLLPGNDIGAALLQAKQHQPRQKLRTLLQTQLPKALASALLDTHYPDHQHKLMADWPDRALASVAELLHDWQLKPAATEGYRTAEVTLGGIDTDEVSSKTMQSKRVPGLYCIGEVLDVTGHLGGFNFQWAWSSAVAAARAL